MRMFNSLRPLLLWYNPSHPSISGHVKQLKLDKNLARYYKLQARTFAREERPFRWYLERPHFLVLLIVFIGPGIVLSVTGDASLGLTLIVTGGLLDILGEIIIAAWKVQLLHKLQSTARRIALSFPNDTMVSSELAWRTLNEELSRYDLSVKAIIASPEWFAATADLIQDYLDATQDMRSALRSSAISGQLRTEAASTLLRCAMLRAAQIKLKLDAHESE